jgi:MoaA/NifB/PqqE/SkfB family radical SAM enzyme
MANAEAQTLIITSRCSGGCLPCPFGQGKLPQRYLGAAEVIEAVSRSAFPLVVITGGEPLEHPHIENIIAGLKSASDSGQCAPFRIATGGHIQLAPVLANLRNCAAFRGVSLGSDVLSRTSIHCETHTPVWTENVRWLNSEKIRYSLTLTLHRSQIEHDALAPLRKAANLGAQPGFVYLRHYEDLDGLALLHKEINKIFENALILCESL